MLLVIEQICGDIGAIYTAETWPAAIELCQKVIEDSGHTLKDDDDLEDFPFHDGDYSCGIYATSN